MRAHFESNHPAGDFSDRTLRVRITRSTSGQSQSDDVSFSVPPDFHAHNDSVAAALMTLIGASCDAVEFNFPISPFCAAMLADYYRLQEIGPTAGGIAPRRPGRYLALNYSGGLDSSAMRALLDAALGSDYRTVGSVYWSARHRESRAIKATADIVCRTDLRRKRFDRQGRFNGTAALLYADYSDLAALTTGHTFGDLPLIWRNLRQGGQPEFLRSDHAYRAGGLPEVHIARACLEPALLKVLIHLRPDWVERALATSDRPGNQKYVAKGLALRALYQESGIPVPAFLDELELPAVGANEGIDGTIHLRSTFLIGRYGREQAARLVPRIARVDLSPLDGLSFRFFTNYHPGMLALFPEDLRLTLPSIFHQCGVLPYNERDYEELEAVRQFFLTVNDHADLTF